MHTNKIVVASANKVARIVWAVLIQEQTLSAGCRLKARRLNDLREETNGTVI